MADPIRSPSAKGAARGSDGHHVLPILDIQHVDKHFAFGAEMITALSDATLRSTALSLRLSPSDIRLLDVPVTQARRGGRPVELVERDQFAELGEALRTDHMAEYVQKYPRG